MEQEINEVYEFLYCDCIYESGYVTMSIHKTKRGAYKALRNYLEEEYAKWRDNALKRGKPYHKFEIHSAWKIDTTILKD